MSVRDSALSGEFKKLRAMLKLLDLNLKLLLRVLASSVGPDRTQNRTSPSVLNDRRLHTRVLGKEEVHLYEKR